MVHQSVLNFKHRNIMFETKTSFLVSVKKKNSYKKKLKTDNGLTFVKSYFKKDSLSTHQIIYWCVKQHKDF